MFDSIFNSVLNSSSEETSVFTFLICIGVSIALGLLISAAYRYQTASSKSFLMTIAILPAIICVVIMMVNGNIGAGIAVAGAFSLVRFRSAPGTAKEIGTLFMSMCIGLMTGMGYLAYAALFTIIMCVVMLIYAKCGLKEKKITSLEKTLLMTVPEDLDYTGAFDEIFNEYTISHELVKAKTSNMGSLYRLKYDITLKDMSQEKMFIDALRCKNGNLEISISVKEKNANEL